MTSLCFEGDPAIHNLVDCLLTILCVIFPTMARTGRQKRLDHPNQAKALAGDTMSKQEMDQVRPALRSLIFPWMLIALCAVSAAAWSTTSLWSGADNATIMEAGAADGVSSSWSDRLLQVSNFQSPSSFGGPPKLVYNEDHEPLFPLSEKDIIGFAFTILGLMVAAGGGIGGQHADLIVRA